MVANGCSCCQPAPALGKGPGGARVNLQRGRLPPQVEPFLFDEFPVHCLSGSFSKLARFWCSRAMVEHASEGGLGKVGGTCTSTLRLARTYLHIGQIERAQRLTLNGAFLCQCMVTPIEKLAKMCGPNFDKVIDYKRVPHFTRGFDSLRAPQAMHSYLEDMLNRWIHEHTASGARGYLGGIADDWTGWSPAKGRKHGPFSGARAPEGTPIRLVLVDGTNEDERQEFDVLSSTALKTLFIGYAEKRGVSLRLLRFSYNGKTLFLSSVGNKSPDELNMKDQDTITAHNTRRETSNKKSETSKPSAAASKTKKAEAKISPRKRAKGKGNKKQTKQGERAEKTVEEHRAQHSKRLSRVHEEVEHRLKEIRTRLNALDLERQPPKQKKKNKTKKGAVGIRASPPRLPAAGVGGRAGRPSFVVNVGEVQNLYRTTKASRRGPSRKFALDLHGRSREGALARLDESLGSWVDAAMGGAYPFVVQVTIVCGCGNQILEETVEGWIREKKNVGNAPNRALR